MKRNIFITCVLILVAVVTIAAGGYIWVSKQSLASNGGTIALHSLLKLRSKQGSAPKIAQVRSPIFGIPCKSNPNIVFDQAFAPPDQIAGIVPSGAPASEEIKPHSYVDLAVESIPVYAPADMELVEGAYYYEPKTFKVPTTYLLHFQISCEVVLMLDHVTHPVQKIKDMFSRTPQQDTRTDTIFKTPQKIKKGELIGYTKGGGNQAALINRFDFGLYKTTHKNAFVNQARYERSKTWKMIHAVCPYDSFIKDLKDAYYGKFTTLNRIPVPGALCRSPNQDKAGTIAGAWFYRENSFVTEPHVAVALELDRKSVIIAGLPRQGDESAIDYKNKTFKDPAEITAGNTHCYYDPHREQFFYFRPQSNLKTELAQGRSKEGCPASFPTSGTVLLYR